MFGQRRTPTSTDSIVFHIGSSYVLGAHVRSHSQNASAVPEILHIEKKELPFTAELLLSDFESSIVKALDVVAGKLIHTSSGTPASITCFLASPWFASQLRTIRLAKHTPFSITQKRIAELVAKDTEAFEREELSRYESGNGSKTVSIERAVMHLKVNGYFVEELQDLKGTELEIGLIASFADGNFIESVRTAIANHFHTRNIAFHTVIHAEAALLERMLVSEEALVIVDVGGEITDCALVAKKGVESLTSFPSGTRTLIREIARRHGGTLNDAQTHLSLYLDGTLESSIARKWKPILDAALYKWTLLFSESLSRLAGSGQLPRTIVLAVPPNLYSLYEQSIKNEQQSQFTQVSGKFIVLPLDHSLLENYLHNPNRGHDAQIAVESLFVTHNKN
jgi:hypothetical protein